MRAGEESRNREHETTDKLIAMGRLLSQCELDTLTPEEVAGVRYANQRVQSACRLLANSVPAKPQEKAP